MALTFTDAEPRVKGVDLVFALQTHLVCFVNTNVLELCPLTHRNRFTNLKPGFPSIV